MHKGTISVQKTDVSNVWGYFAGPSTAKESEKGTRKGRQSEEKGPPKARVKHSTKGGGEGERSGVERAHGSADVQWLEAGRAEVAAMASQGSSGPPSSKGPPQ